jgi:hypothetical protein
VLFDQGSVLSVRATFGAPAGPHAPGTQFAATVGVRTGDDRDLFAEARTAATLQVRANAARLNVVGAAQPLNLANMPQQVYDAIFDPIEPQPFTLEILVDRVAGTGEAMLKVGDWVVSAPFKSAVFQAASGPAITAAGVSIAVASGAGETATVRVDDFQIFTMPPERK